MCDYQYYNAFSRRDHSSPLVVLVYLIHSVGPPWDTTTPDTCPFSYTLDEKGDPQITADGSATYASFF